MIITRPWSVTGEFVKCKECGKKFWCYKHLIGKRKYCSKECYYEWMKGKVGNSKGTKRGPHTKEHRKKISLAGIGRVASKETRRKLSIANLGYKCKFWKGGISKVNERIRKSVEYKLWREAVFERDNYTCKFCGERGGKLNADHIKPFALFPELRFAIDNGRTLCVECHRKTPTYGRNIKK